MPRFFVEKEMIFSEDGKKIAVITDKDAFHIARSLRMAVGEYVTVCDNGGTEYACRLTQITDSKVTAIVESESLASTEPPFRACLFQALPKGDKLDMIIQKSVECGVKEIVPFESERCVVKVKHDSEQRKTERRCKIALEASKQCGRGEIVKVHDTVSYDTMLEMVKGYDLKLFCYEKEKATSIKQVLSELREKGEKVSSYSIAILVGSEGGFSEREAEKAISCGCIPVSLGSRILRTETAPIFVLSCLVYDLEI